MESAASARWAATTIDDLLDPCLEIKPGETGNLRTATLKAGKTLHPTFQVLPAHDEHGEMIRLSFR